MKLFLPGALADAEFPDPPFLVSPLLPRGGVGVLHGPQGSGKTQLCLALAGSIAGGYQFLRQWNVTKGNVLMIEADMPLQGFQARVVKSGVTGVSFLWSEEFDVLSLAHSTVRPAELTEAIGLTPDLVIVDSIRQTHDLPENETTTPKRVYKAWKRLFPQAAIFLTHHNRKKNSDGYEASLRESARGADWLNEADCGIHLARSEAIGPMSASLTFTKHRYCEQPPVMNLSLDPSTLLLRPR